MTNFELAFRPAGPADLPLINQMMRAGKEYWGYPEEGLDRFMNSFAINDPEYFDQAIGFVAESPQGVVGFYLIKIEEGSPMLDHFIIATQYIGQGYARPLWNHCVSLCQEKGWAEFTFWSDPHAQGFYEHMGCTKIEDRPMITLPGHMAPIMRFVVPS